MLLSLLNNLFQRFLGNTKHLAPGHTLHDDAGDGTAHVHIVHLPWWGLLNGCYPAID